MNSTTQRGNRLHRAQTKFLRFVIEFFTITFVVSAFIPARPTSRINNSQKGKTNGNTFFKILAKSSFLRLNLLPDATSRVDSDDVTSPSKTCCEQSRVEFISPLLHDGYPPAVLEYEHFKKGEMGESRFEPKPILLYLPGFDGTLMAPFLQFPSLGEEFDVRGMTIDMDDRSTFLELKQLVLKYIFEECGFHREIYLMGESFGGILAMEVAITMGLTQQYKNVQLRGLILVNPATCYLRSNLYEIGQTIANFQARNHIISFAEYLYSLTTELVPLFLDEGKAIQQLMAIIASKGLPSVVNNSVREAYMGRVAFDLPNRLRFMPQVTLKWRLEQWLEYGCGVWGNTLTRVQAARDPNTKSGDNYLSVFLQQLKTLIVAGEIDSTLPSLDEARKLELEVFGSDNVRVHIVPGAGHASTCGGSLNLVQLLRDFFPGLPANAIFSGDTQQAPDEDIFGLVPRYDGASIGLSPLLYWSADNYRQWEE